MTNIDIKTSKLVRLVFGIVMSVYTVVLAALVLCRVLDIYFTGHAAGDTSPYSYEVFMGRLTGELAAPFWIWVVLIIAGFVLWEVFYIPEKRKGLTDARYVLQRLQKRIPAEVGSDLEDSFMYVKKEQKRLNILRLCLYILAALFVVYVIVYMSIPANFPNKDKTADMLRLSKFILPVAAVVYAAGLAYVIYYGYSAKRQLPYVKKLTKGITQPQKKAGKFVTFIQSKNFILALRIAVACFGVAFVVAGCFNGSIMEVLNKAINICTECIGLG